MKGRSFKAAPWFVLLLLWAAQARISAMAADEHDHDPATRRGCRRVAT
jgi:hypothetical protein